MVAVIPLDILPLIFEQLLLSCRTPHERKEALYSLKRVSRTFFHEVAPFSELIITSVPQLLCLSNELEDWPAARKPSRLSLAFSQYDWHSIDDREEWDEFRRAKQRIQAQLPDISSLEVMGAFGHEVLAEEWDDTRPTLRRVVIGGSGRFLCDCPRRWLSSFDMVSFLQSAPPQLEEVEFRRGVGVDITPGVLDLNPPALKSFGVAAFQSRDPLELTRPYPITLLPNLTHVLSASHASLRTLSLMHHPFSLDQLLTLLKPFPSLNSLSLFLPYDPSAAALTHFFATLGTRLATLISLGLSTHSIPNPALPTLFESLHLLSPLRHFTPPPPLFPSLRIIRILPRAPGNPFAPDHHREGLRDALASLVQNLKRGTFDEFRVGIDIVGNVQLGLEKDIRARVGVLGKNYGVRIEMYGTETRCRQERESH